MKLIVGLGNPGKKYEKTRHNIGFMALDLFASKHKLTFKYDSKIEGAVAEVFIGNTKTILLKPATFMNLSGNSVSKAINYFKISIDNVLVIYDDMHLDIGTLRLRETGSSGGQKGIADIINHLKTNQVKRVRVGIGQSNDAVDHVLSKFSRKEKKDIDIKLEEIVDIIEDFSKDKSFENIMNRYN